MLHKNHLTRGLYEMVSVRHWNYPAGNSERLQVVVMEPAGCVAP